MNLRVRLDTKEQLDNFSLSGPSLHKTLSSLRLINILFGNRRQLSKAVLKYCKQHSYQKTFRIVDLGCGSGDCLMYISKKLNKHGIDASFTGIDANPESISIATQKTLNTNNIKFLVQDILEENFSLPECDILVSSHFIYHFKDKELISFLEGLSYQNVKHVIFSELYRSKMAYLLFKTVRYLLPITNMAKEDGLIAIRRAFLQQELETIIRKSGYTSYTISTKPFFRFTAEINIQ